MADLDYKIIVGLEIHVQLATETKMFCSCALSFGQEPNSRVCPVCIGLPGALPVMNKRAVEFSLLAGMALNCEIPHFTKWDRKSYYYPDLPKNYQISQYDLPLNGKGFIEIPLADGSSKKIRITRAHLEEDAGKNLHSGDAFSRVDLNRAGTPLLEIVTEPDLSSGAEVKALAVELQRIVRYLGISEADMQKGHMRFEPNINLAITKDGKEYRTPITEVKNLNSFRSLQRSVEYEARRQLNEFIDTGKTMVMGNKSTYGWDDNRSMTVLQRVKEEAHDYRYFPDPDLVPVEVNENWLSEIRSGLCELPLQKQKRFIEQFGLSDYDAGVITADKATSDFFDAAVKAGAEAKRVCNLLTQTGLKLANEKNCSVKELGVSAQALAKLCEMADAGKVSATAAQTIFIAMTADGRDPEIIAEEKKLLQKNDAGELEKIVAAVITQNPEAVAEVKHGGKKSKKANGFLMGQIMKAAKGSANPKIAAQILSQKLQR